MSSREDILAYLAAQVGAITGLSVYRSREAAVARAEGTVLIIRPVEEHVIRFANEVTARELHVMFILIVRGAVPDTTADPYITQIVSLIQSDTTLGGLAARCIEKSTKWDMQVADVTALVIELTFIVKYLTRTSSISTLA